MAKQTEVPFLEKGETPKEAFNPRDYKDFYALMKANPTEKQIVEWTKQHFAEEEKLRLNFTDQYFAAKEKVLPLEKKNTDTLYIIETEDHFFKMFGNSAQIWAYILCPELKKRTPNFHTDKDKMYHNRNIISKSLYVTFKDMASFKKDLAQLGIKKPTRKGALIKYELPAKYRITLEQIRNLKQREDAEWDRINTGVLPRKVFPSVYTRMRETESTLYQIARPCNPIERAMFMDGMMKTIAELIRQYIKTVNNWEGLDAKEFIAFGLESVHNLRTGVVIIEMHRMVSTTLAQRLERKLEILEEALINAQI